MKKVTKVELILLFLILGAFSIFVVPRIIFRGEGVKAGALEKGKGLYHCPMHPTYVSDRPGDCPICNMKMVPRPGAGEKKKREILYYRHPMGQPDISPVPKKDSMGMDYIAVYEDEIVQRGSSVPGHSAVQIPIEKQQVMGVKVGAVEKRKLVKAIRTAGRVAYDPELFSAQEEFISAVESRKEAEKGPYHEPIERAEALVDAARIRLHLLGMSESEIVELEKEAVRDRTLILGTGSARTGSPEPVRQNRYQVWVYANIYEYELPFVKIGTQIKVRVPTFPDKEFTGEVRALDPVLDSATRSIRIRARAEDPEGLLRPDLYVDVSLESDLGELLALPEEAVLQTGERTIVFVLQGEGLFEPREVKLGTKAENSYEVLSGLQAGERVALSGNFLIDSESRLQSALAGMTPAAGEHQHG